MAFLQREILYSSYEKYCWYTTLLESAVISLFLMLIPCINYYDNGSTHMKPEQEFTVYPERLPYEPHPDFHFNLLDIRNKKDILTHTRKTFPAGIKSQHKDRGTNSRRNYPNYHLAVLSLESHPTTYPIWVVTPDEQFLGNKLYIHAHSHIDEKYAWLTIIKDTPTLYSQTDLRIPIKPNTQIENHSQMLVDGFYFEKHHLPEPAPISEFAAMVDINDTILPVGTFASGVVEMGIFIDCLGYREKKHFTHWIKVSEVHSNSIPLL